MVRIAGFFSVFNFDQCSILEYFVLLRNNRDLKLHFHILETRMN